MDKTEFWLRLLMVKGIGVKKLNMLAKTFNQHQGNIDQMLTVLALNEQQYAGFFSPSSRYLDSSFKWLSQQGNQMLLLGEPNYPPLLRQITHPPTVLFVRGSHKILHTPQLAIIGSRNCNHYGQRWAGYFAKMLSTNGLTITSGLALGIDGIAHHHTLEAQGATVAVLGSGLAQIYPRRHLQLAEQIVDQGGALISEFLPTVAPLALNFPRRNRIISGLSLAVLVIQASLRSGSLITARYALEQGREVFALPGSLDGEESAGCHWLIQQGAYLVVQPTDILEQLRTSLQWIPLSTIEKEQSTIPKLEEQQNLPFAEVLANVADEVTPIDLIAEKTQQAVPDVAIQLLELELAGWIATAPGGYIRLK